jgi:hypothetical protein
MIIIDEFSVKTVLPIKIDEIAQFILKKGFVKRIVYHPYDMEPEKLAGMLLLEKPKVIAAPYEGDGEVANIAYSTQLSLEEQRLVITKELLHICDAETVRVSSRKQVSDLVEWFGIPLEARMEIAKVSPEVASDQSTILLALEVLLPRAARDELRPHLECGNITEAGIAALAHIPKAYVRTVMMKHWPKLIEAILKSHTPT